VPAIDTHLTHEIDTYFPEEERDDLTATSLIDSLEILWAHRGVILIVTAAAAALSVLIACLLPVSFKAEALIMPPQQQQQSSLAALASGALGGLAGNAGMASSLGLKNPSDLYIGILQSRSIADDIVRRFRLQDVYHKQRISETRQALAKHVSFSSGKDSLIRITVEDHDASRAADITNAYVDELHSANSRLALTDASQRRLFYEQELSKEKDALANAEVALKQNQQKSGMVLPAGQAQLLLHSGAQLRAEIASRQVQMEAMRSYATDENPQLQVLKRETEALRSQLAQLQSKSDRSGFEMSAGQLPDTSLEYLRRMRDVKYHETLFELLSRQYEAARIDEAKQAPVIQVIDRAVVPDKKSWPPRAMLVVAGTLLGFAAGAGAVFIRRKFATVLEYQRLGSSAPAAPRVVA
jgi:tyrosine-protein kinase Etk/Wzc